VSAWYLLFVPLVTSAVFALWLGVGAWWYGREGGGRDE
jgi:hypothetical protein